jgi:hypothetical protein
MARGVKKRAAEIADAMEASKALAADAEIARLRGERDSYKSRYRVALQAIEAERSRGDMLAGLSQIKPARVVAAGKKRGSKHAATVVVLLSDWHCEEFVDPATVNFQNSYNLDVCKLRVAELTERFATLLEHERRLADISRVVVWLGGDFLTGHIHEDCVEVAQLAPLAALRFAGGLLRGLLDTVAGLADSVVVATNSGNHGRSNAGKMRIATELEHSFEQYLYLQMAAQEQRPNVEWRVGAGYLNYVDLDGFLIRFHHGHAIRYSGAGVGGITIPVNKSIAAWDKVTPADLTCFGHYHQFQWLRGGRYVANGSLIGHSAYATVVCKGETEPPCQSMIVIDHRRHEVTRAYPIFVDRDLRESRACSPANNLKRRNKGRAGLAAPTLAQAAPSRPTQFAKSK